MRWRDCWKRSSRRGRGATRASATRGWLSWFWRSLPWGGDLRSPAPRGAHRSANAPRIGEHADQEVSGQGVASLGFVSKPVPARSASEWVAGFPHTRLRFVLVGFCWETKPGLLIAATGTVLFAPQRNFKKASVEAIIVGHFPPHWLTGAGQDFNRLQRC